MTADLRGVVFIIAVWFAVSCLVAVAHHVVRGRVRQAEKQETR